MRQEYESPKAFLWHVVEYDEGCFTPESLQLDRVWSSFHGDKANNSRGGSHLSFAYLCESRLISKQQKTVKNTM